MSTKSLKVSKRLQSAVSRVTSHLSPSLLYKVYYKGETSPMLGFRQGFYLYAVIRFEDIFRASIIIRHDGHVVI